MQRLGLKPAYHNAVAKRAAAMRAGEERESSGEGDWDIHGTKAQKKAAVKKKVRACMRVVRALRGRPPFGSQCTCHGSRNPEGASLLSRTHQPITECRPTPTA